MTKVPRHEFVETPFRHLAYDDTPLPIGFDQTISQPFVVGYMTEAAKISPEEKVLEIGTGSGYQAAILCGACARGLQDRNHSRAREPRPESASRARLH